MTVSIGRYLYNEMAQKSTQSVDMLYLMGIFTVINTCFQKRRHHVNKKKRDYEYSPGRKALSNNYHKYPNEQ